MSDTAILKARDLIVEALTLDLFDSGVIPKKLYDQKVTASQNLEEKLEETREDLANLRSRLADGIEFLFARHHRKTLYEARCPHCSEPIQLFHKRILDSLSEQGFFILRCGMAGCGYTSEKTAAELLTEMSLLDEHRVIGLSSAVASLPTRETPTVPQEFTREQPGTPHVSAEMGDEDRATVVEAAENSGEKVPRSAPRYSPAQGPRVSQSSNDEGKPGKAAAAAGEEDEEPK